MDVGLFFTIAAQVVGGLGIFLLGMKNMSEGLQVVSGDRLRKMIGAVTNNRLMAVGVGMLVTMLVQSSSISTVMVVGFVNSGIMNLMQAIGVILGANIGTTITAWLASLGTTTTAKRAAYAHVLFNVIGTAWFIAIFPVVIRSLSHLIELRTGYNPQDIHIDNMDEGKFGQIITAGIALTHTSFNVANVLFFLPFAGILAKVVTRLVPDRETKEIHHLTFLDIRMLDTPSLGIVQSQKQLDFMAESVEGMMENLRTCLHNGLADSELVSKIFHREEILDNVQKEIFLYLSHLVSGQVPLEITRKAHQQMRIADEYESLSDYVVNVLKGLRKMEQNHQLLDELARDKLVRLHDRAATYILRVNKSMTAETKGDLAWATSEGSAIGEFMKELRRQHLERLQKEEVSPFFSLAFTDMLNYYRRIKDHALNIAAVVAGEK